MTLSQRCRVLFLILTGIFPVLQKESTAEETFAKTPLTLRYRDAICRVSSFSDESGNYRGFKNFPAETIWCFARIDRVRVVPNSVSIAIENDSIEGRYWENKKGRKEHDGRQFVLTFDKANISTDYVVGMEGYIGLTKKGQLFRMCFPAKPPVSYMPGGLIDQNDGNDMPVLKLDRRDIVAQYSPTGFAGFPPVVYWYSMRVDRLVSSGKTNRGPVTAKGRMWRVGAQNKDIPPRPVELTFESKDIGRARLRRGMHGYVGLTPAGELFNAWFPAPPHGSELAP